MKILTYRIQFIILAIWIPVVLILFKVIDDKTLAAMLAGAGFVLWPLIFLINELFVMQRSKHKLSIIHLIGCLQFLILFALPIMYLRISNLNAPFNELSLLGVPGSQLHRFSNISYMIMTVAVVYASYEARKNKNR